MEKIRKSMRREDGFTLVELLAVIVILGIIVAIAIPAIGNVIERADTGASAAEKVLVVDAARLYMTVETSKVDLIGTWPHNLKVSELKSTGYLDNRASEIDDDDYVEVSKETSGTDGLVTYKYVYKSK